MANLDISLPICSKRMLQDLNQIFWKLGYRVQIAGWAWYTGSKCSECFLIDKFPSLDSFWASLRTCWRGIASKVQNPSKVLNTLRSRTKVFPRCQNWSLYEQERCFSEWWVIPNLAPHSIFFGVLFSQMISVSQGCPKRSKSETMKTFVWKK